MKTKVKRETNKTASLFNSCKVTSSFLFIPRKIKRNTGHSFNRLYLKYSETKIRHKCDYSVGKPYSLILYMHIMDL